MTLPPSRSDLFGSPDTGLVKTLITQLFDYVVERLGGTAATATAPEKAAACAALGAVSLTGDTMTGSLNVPSLNGGQLAGLRNKIINGKMEVAQLGTAFAAVVTGSYTLDCWSYNGVAGTSAVTITQQTDVPGDNQFVNSLRVAVTAADASIAAGEGTFLTHVIEGANVRDLIGRSFTLSFRVRSSKTGTHCVAFRNSGTDRSYVAEYTINAANTWETKSITVPAGLITAGTWNWANGVGLYLNFALAVGATFQGAPGVWQVGNFLGSANQVNCLDAIGNIFAITGVQLEVGALATPFEHRLSGLEMLLAMRYFEIVNSRSFLVMGWPGVGCEQQLRFCVRKRTPPTVTPQFSSLTNVQYGAYTAPGPAAASEIGVDSCQMNYGAPPTWGGNGTTGRVSNTNTGSYDIHVNARF